MSFAEKQLAKFGWKSGDGLGKNSDGIKKSISVVKKNDTKGLGGKLDKWDFAWWDHVFNKSASNIQVNKDESGEVKVEKAASTIQVSRMGIISTSRPAGPSLSTTSSPATSTPSTMGSMTPRDDYDDDEDKPAPAAKSGPSWLFGFVKASASSVATEEAKRTNQVFTASADSFAARADGYDELKAAEADEYKDYTIKVSDKELFEACEGRTARKGARGEQPGKLGRVMKELLLESDPKKASTSDTKEVKAAKKQKKEKKDKKEKSTKKDKKDKEKKKETKEKEKKVKKEKKEKKDKKTENSAVDSSQKSRKEKKVKEEKKSKRHADDDEPRPSKKAKKSTE
ncbi:G patch domain-containing protein 4 [Dissophora globulifera]|nr:G patch domain-containing protein 4 [Dissophora globulifera]